MTKSPGLHLLRLFCLSFLGMILACKSKDVAQTESIKSKTLAPVSANWGQKITIDGSNDSPKLSPSGRKITYSSKRRRTHQQAQIYQFDLDLVRERRITYQDGDAFNPLVLAENEEIIYASTTDEIKERPPIFFPEIWQSSFPGSEIYLIDTRGIDVTRLTHQYGFQGDLSFANPKQDSLVLSSWNQNTMNIGILNLESKRLNLIGDAIKDQIRSPLMIKHNQFVWVQKNEATKQDLVYRGKPGANPSTVGLPASEVQSLHWWDQEKEQILLSARIQGQNNFGIYLLDMKKNCFQTLLTSKESAFDPEVSSDKEWIVLAVEEPNGAKQIYLKSTQGMNLSCPETIPTINTVQR